MVDTAAGRATLVDGAVGPTLRRLAVPMGVGFVFMIAVNLIDTFWVARLGTEPLAAMSFTFPVVSVVIAIAVGLMIGASTAIARAIGRGDERDVRRLTTHALLLGVLVVLGVSAVGLLGQRAIFTLLGADPTVIPMVESYMTIWLAGAFFVVVPMMANGALRAAGDAKTPMLMMATAAVLNAALDPIFIFGWGPIPAMGLEGAAVATVIARVAGMLLAFWILFVRARMVELHVPRWGELRDSWRRILSVGLPAAITNLLSPVATAALTALVAGYGTAAVAAYGVGARLEGLVLIAPFALGSALSPFIGQNWGAHLGGRVAESVRLGLRFVIIWGLAVFLVLALGAPWLAAAFTHDPDVEQALVAYLQVVPIGYAAGSTVGVASAAFNAMDRAVRSTLLSMLRSLVVAVPVAWIGGMLFGLRGVFMGLVVAALVASLLGVRWLGVMLRPEAQATAEDPALITDLAAAVATHGAALRSRVAALIEVATAMPDVEVHRTRREALGFFVGQRELGHVHPDGHLDLGLPPDLGEALVRAGRLEHHRRVSDAGWYTHRLQDAADVAEASALVHLAHALCALRRDGGGRDEAHLAFAALGLPPACQEAALAAAARWPQPSPTGQVTPVPPSPQ